MTNYEFQTSALSEKKKYASEYDRRKKDALRAASHGTLYFLKDLLTDGVEVNGLSHCGRNTILIAAISSCRLDKVEFVLSQGANVNEQTDTGHTALMEAGDMGDERMVKLLLDKGAEVNHKDANGKTALMYAAYSGNPEAVKALILHGADVWAKCGCGLTSLEQAKIGERHFEEYLTQKHRAIKDIYDESLYRIAEYSAPEHYMVKSLLRKKLKQLQMAA
ncbi:ankyrin repeat domain-containing protein [Bdellovibrionota bacterium FG-2]